MKFKPLTSENIIFLQPHNLVKLGRHYKEKEIAKLCGVALSTTRRKLEDAQLLWKDKKEKKRLDKLNENL
jgi:U3 small nucleolar ribonucleoprotein component